MWEEYFHEVDLNNVRFLPSLAYGVQTAGRVVPADGEMQRYWLNLRLDEEYKLARKRLEAVMTGDDGDRDTSVWYTMRSVRGAGDTPKEYTDTLYWDSELSILSALGCW